MNPCFVRALLSRRWISPWSDVRCKPIGGAGPRKAQSRPTTFTTSLGTLAQSPANANNGLFIPSLVEPLDRDCSQCAVTATGSYSRYEFPVSISFLQLEIGRCGGDLKLRSNFSPGMRTTASINAASNLNMPALSPTMTEGTISSWKVKEGSFYPVAIRGDEKIGHMHGAQGGIAVDVMGC